MPETKQQETPNQIESSKKVTLREPITFEGRTITEINLDFNELRGKTLREVERRYYRLGGSPMAMKAALSEEYCMLCASAISNEPTEVFDKLNGADYQEIITAVQFYFFGLDIPEEVHSPTSEGGASS